MKVAVLVAIALAALSRPTFAVAQDRQPSPTPAVAYSQQVYLHLQQYKGISRGAAGLVIVKFALDRDGGLVRSAVLKSSGIDSLDQEALAILQRAAPFPKFPATKPGSLDTFAAPMRFVTPGLACEPGTMIPMQDGQMHVCQ